MSVKRLDWAAIGAIVCQLGLAAFILRFGKAGPLPMHFGLDGHVDRWGDRRELAAVAGALPVFGALTYALLPALSRGRGVAAAGLGLTYARVVILCVTSLISLLFVVMSLGVVTPVSGGVVTGRVLMAFLAALTLAIGALIGKVGPNPFVGIRTYWALKSRLAWERSNRLLGRLWFWLGLVGLVASPLAPQPAGAMVVVALMVACALAAVFESWRVWRGDPDRAVV